MLTAPALALVVGTITPTQQVREPALLTETPAGSFTPVSVVSRDEVSIALWTEERGQFFRASDGRGVSWTDPIAVHPWTGSTDLSDVAALEGTAYLLWSDDVYDDGSAPLTAQTVFLRTWDAATETLGPVIEIPDGPADPALTRSFGDIDVVRVGSEIRVHVVVSRRVYTAGTGDEEYSYVLVSSHDGGATFPFEVALHASETSSGTVGVRATEDAVHVLWVRAEEEASLAYQRSSDGGSTVDHPDGLSLGSATSAPRLYVQGENIVVSAGGDLGKPDYEKFFLVHVSTDGGDTFETTKLVSEEDDFGAGSAVFDGGTETAVAVMTMGLGHPVTRAYVSRSVNGGASWSEPEPLDPPSPLGLLEAAADGRSRLIRTWWEDDQGDEEARLHHSVSRDGGVSWSAPILEANNVPWAVRQTYNDHYQNTIVVWSDEPTASPTGVYAGGFRPQTLTPTGFEAGATVLGAEFEAFDDRERFACFLLSDAPGDSFLPHGDGRNLGLAPSPLLSASIDLVFAGPFLTTLGEEGSGALAPIAAVLPSPWTVYAVGVALDPAEMSFGDIADVVRVDL